MTEPTIEDIDALVGPATPHFAFQIRARVREAIAGLPEDHPVRRYAEEKLELLDRLGFASTKAENSEPESRDAASAGRRSRRPRRRRTRCRAATGERRRAHASSSPEARAGSARRSRCGSRATARRASAIGYFRSDAAAEETAEELRALGAEPVLVRGNITSSRVAEQVAALGPLDVLVHNAATGVIRPALETEDKHWDWTLNANARALLSLTRVAAPSMPPGSSIVAISSLGSVRVLENYSLVGTSKAALEALVRYLAVELAPRGIRVNAVSAGVVATGALEHFPNREEMLASGGAQPGGQARHARRHRRRRRVPLLARRRDDPRPDGRDRRRLVASRRLSTLAEATQAPRARPRLGRDRHRAGHAPHGDRALRRPRGVRGARGGGRARADARRGDRGRDGDDPRAARRGRRVARRARPGARRASTSSSRRTTR